jgi:ACS family hexuronate transporter-like MFS transporter
MMANATTSNGAPPRFRWDIALILCAAIAISYLDRQTLPWAIKAIQVDIPFDNQTKAGLDSAFLVTYGLMYLGGGLILDRIGTKLGFLCIMVVWSLACASHGLAGGVLALGASRLMLGLGEGGGFSAATRAVAEWFAPQNRATAMGVVNGGTAVGAVLAPPLIALVLTQVHWFALASWRWVFFLTGALGVAWVIWWALAYRAPPCAASETDRAATPRVTLRQMLAHREVWAVIAAKFLSDGAWYFYLFWLPKYLFEAFGLDIRTAGGVGWIPYAASGVGCLVGGALSSFLLRRGGSVNAARKIALGVSAALMPWVMLAPHVHSIGWVIFLFSVAFFGQQSWSTLVMILPTDMIGTGSVGALAGLVGLGGAMGGVLLGQVVGWLRDHGYSYQPALIIAGSLHIVAFAILCLAIPNIQQLVFKPRTRP